MARSREREDSVYDFLYVDANRIGVLLSQFGTDGVLTELTRATTETSESGGGLDIKIIRANHKEAAQSGLTRRYDPRWLIPLLFLRDAQDMLIRDISKASIGQLVLMDGALSVLDAAMLPKIYGSKTYADHMVKVTVDSSVDHWRQDSKNSALPTAQRTKAEKEFREIVQVNARHIVDTFGNFSFGPQFTIKKDGITVWSTLSPEGLIGTPEDIFLKHGTEIPGLWYALGVLDALPSPIDPIIEVPMVATREVQNLSTTVKNQSNVWRTRIGRPADAYGVTTLLIFRPVGQPINL